MRSQKLVEHNLARLGSRVRVSFSALEGSLKRLPFSFVYQPVARFPQLSFDKTGRSVHPAENPKNSPGKAVSTAFRIPHSPLALHHHGVRSAIAQPHNSMTFKIICRKDVVYKNNTSPLCLFLFHNGRKKSVGLGISVNQNTGMSQNKEYQPYYQVRYHDIWQ